MRSSVTQDYYTLSLQNWSSRSILALRSEEEGVTNPTELIMGRANLLLDELDEEEVIVEINKRPEQSGNSPNAQLNITDLSLTVCSGLSTEVGGTLESQ
jgi:hypothetical protein